TTSGVIMSSNQYLDEEAVSPGSTKLLSVVMATLCSRPTPASSMPPHHNGMPCFSAKSWILIDWVIPPTRPTLTLIILQLPISIAAAADSYESILSSRHTG